MKCVFLLCVLLVGVNIKGISQKLTYLDENGMLINKSRFKELQNDARFKFTALDEKTNRIKIVFDRVERGQIDHYVDFIQNLDSLSNFTLDKSKPIVIIYYPGPDKCNTTGTSTPKESKRWYAEMEKKSEYVPKTNFLYIYKNIEALKTIKLINWQPDPNQLIEQTFFPFHYLCGSFAIVSEGNFISFLGEYAKETVWKIQTEITKQKH